MKATNFFLTFLFALMFGSCYKTIDRKTTQVIQVPIYQYTTVAEAEAGLTQGAPTKLTSFGNIYSYNNYLLINERGSGIHIYDNANPENPVQVSFMNVPGNQNFSIQNNILYADSYDDIVVLDISDINKITLVKRIDSVFPEQHPSNGIIIGYKDSTIETFEEISPNLSFINENDDPVFTTNSPNQLGNKNAANQVGVGGSFARFIIENNHLFAIDSRVLNVFDLANPTNPIKSSSTFINEVAEIETLFTYQNNLFIGSTDGLLIYDISNPSDISFESVFSHARACDPVYVENDVAYVTLRSNLDRCFGVNNQLDVIDVSDVSSPSLIQTFPMLNPHGVGVDDSLLFVCEASQGLKIFETDKSFEGKSLKSIKLKLLSFNQSIYAYDVIPLNGLLIVVGDQSLFQYNYSNPANIKLLSKIE